MIHETKRLFIRPWLLEDAADYLRLSCDEGFNQFVITEYRQENMEEALRWIRDQRRVFACTELGMWPVRERDCGELIGICGLRKLIVDAKLPERVEITYRFRRDRWGKGFATEVALAVLNHGFVALRLPEIAAVILEGNDASTKVAARIGMRHEQDRLFQDRKVSIWTKVF